MQSIIESILRLLRLLFGSDQKELSSAKNIESRSQAVDFQHFYAKSSLLSKVENSFYSSLCLALGDQFVIAMKVRTEDVIGVKKSKREYGEVQSDRGRIKSRHFDFVVCNLGLRPLVIIEVDDASHNSQKARKTDAFKDDLAEAVGVPLVRFAATPTANADAIRMRLGEALRK